uniref:Uncharacterized protein n=1 Tax=Kalanchoe fedtschenkoi TaxID=63787 RepID=A0A7N0VL49_KALFE
MSKYFKPLIFYHLKQMTPTEAPIFWNRSDIIDKLLYLNVKFFHILNYTNRELLKGPLYYALAATIACAVYWRTSPVAIAIICNLCAGDGLADIIGRRFGDWKLPHNGNKSFAGSITMAVAGFLASVAYMHYFSMFGFVTESSDMIRGLLAVSLGAALVESLPISTTLDDNLTVPLTSILLGSLVFNS